MFLSISTNYSTIPKGIHLFYQIYNIFFIRSIIQSNVILQSTGNIFYAYVIHIYLRVIKIINNHTNIFIINYHYKYIIIIFG